MNLDDLARKAGFYTNNGDIFSPNVKERITPQLAELIKLIESEVLSEIHKQREPNTLNYSTNEKYSELVKYTLRSRP